MGWVLDLDGVVWLADDPIPGASEAIGRIRSAGEPIVFVSNNSSGLVSDVEAKLARHGIPTTPGEVVTSATALATLVRAGERVLVCGGPGLRDAVSGRGATAVDGLDESAVDAVAVGFHREFDYERMRVASTAVRNGARLLASNDDATYPTPAGPIPGAGSLLASVERASGRTAVVAGKPYAPMADLVRGLIGPSGFVVGDRPDTDGRFAVALGYPFALVLSGVTKESDLPVEPAPAEVAPDLATLVAKRLDR